jgi:D-alanyl-lipoteichoic acid acyltransferase DltB (MBOAT superfamily)
MLFNSLEFAIFLPLVVGLYFCLPSRYRTPMLLIASCIFYMAFIPVYILILFVTIAIDYIAGIYIERTNAAPRGAPGSSAALSQRALCCLSSNISISSPAISSGWRTSWLAIAKTSREYHPADRSLVSHFSEPQLRGRGLSQTAEGGTSFHHLRHLRDVFPATGRRPHRTPAKFAASIYEKHDFDYERVTAGLKRMAWGFSRRLVIADRLALM